MTTEGPKRLRVMDQLVLVLVCHISLFGYLQPSITLPVNVCYQTIRGLFPGAVRKSGNDGDLNRS